MILFVDDEPREMRSFVDELRDSNYEVKFIEDVDTALEFFEDNADSIYLVILDIMMPAGKSFKHEFTKEGLRTGFFIYEIIRKRYSDLPIIIFSNVPEDSLSKKGLGDDQEEMLEKIQKDKNCFYLQKEDVFPYELLEEIKKILKH